jgi:uncharacterized protein (DUF58 family)
MRPGAALFIAALCWLFLGTVSFFSPPVFLVWFLTGACLLPFIAADALILLLLTDRLAPERELQFLLAQGREAEIKIRFRRGKKPLLPGKFMIFDLYPGSMDCSVFPKRLAASPLKKQEILDYSYTLRPRERGPWIFPGLELLLDSPLRFWRLRVFHECVSRGKTYPDFKKISGAALEGTLDKKGLRNIRKRGQGLEFMDLRDYQDGDPIKTVDWRASGRKQKLIVREYQEEQDQQILIVLDSGYRMGKEQFDSALNALLLLSYTALKHGDAAAVLTFGAGERWLPPRKGIKAITELMNGLYDLQSSPAPSSPFSALENALARLHRRSFIVLISNFREEDGESLSWILPRIIKRHLLLLVSFREAEAEMLAKRRVRGHEETLETAAAFSYLAARRRLRLGWEGLGLLTMETSGEKISSALINRYLEVKRSGRL